MSYTLNPTIGEEIKALCEAYDEMYRPMEEETYWEDSEGHLLWGTSDELYYVMEDLETGEEFLGDLFEANAREKALNMDPDQRMRRRNVRDNRQTSYQNTGEKNAAGGPMKQFEVSNRARRERHQAMRGKKGKWKRPARGTSEMPQTPRRYRGGNEGGDPYGHVKTRAQGKSTARKEKNAKDDAMRGLYK